MDVIIVGEVLGEDAVQERDGFFDGHDWTVRVAAVLSGESYRSLTVTDIGMPTCSRAQLSVGEHVLLLLKQGPNTVLVVPQDDHKYSLANSQATSSRYPPVQAQDAIRRVAAITGASDEQLDAALAFARGEPAPEPPIEDEPIRAVDEDGDGPSALIIGLATTGGAALLVVVSAVALRYLRRRSVNE